MDDLQAVPALSSRDLAEGVVVIWVCPVPQATEDYGDTPQLWVVVDDLAPGRSAADHNEPEFARLCVDVGIGGEFSDRHFGVGDVIVAHTCFLKGFAYDFSCAARRPARTQDTYDESGARQ